MVNDSYFRFDDDNKIKYTFSRPSQENWVSWRHTAPYSEYKDNWENCLNLRHTLGIIYLTSILVNRMYLPFPLLSYFSVAVCLRCLLHHILSLIAYTLRETREFVFIIIVQFMMSAYSRIRFALQIVLVCLYSTPSHYHYCSLCKLIWRHWTYKMPLRYILSVC